MMLPKSIAEIITPLAGDLDNGIADLVLAMRELGFETVSSCEGHFRPGEFCKGKPNVVFVALDRGLLHSWIREISLTESPEVLPIGIAMFPVWSPDRQIVHEDNWTLEIDASECADHIEAENRRTVTVEFLLATLEAASRRRPLAEDSFVRS